MDIFDVSDVSILYTHTSNLLCADVPDTSSTSAPNPLLHLSQCKRSNQARKPGESHTSIHRHSGARLRRLRAGRRREERRACNRRHRHRALQRAGHGHRARRRQHRDAGVARRGREARRAHGRAGVVRAGAQGHGHVVA